MNKNKFFISIKLRFSIYFGLFLSLFLAIFGYVAYYLYSNIKLNNAKEIIKIEFLNIKNSINSVYFNNNKLELEEDAIYNIEDATNLGLLVFIFDSKGKTLMNPTSLDTFIPKGKDGYFDININNDDYIFFAGRIEHLSIYIGMNRALQNHNTESLLNVIFILWILVSSISFVIGYLFSVGALAPINRLINDVKKIDANKIKNKKLKDNYIDDEIGILAGTFDDFLTRISDFLLHEKEFTQDISHELRTPLMIIKTSLELISGESLSEYQKEKIKMMEYSVSKIENLISELLFLARNHNDITKNDIDINIFLEDFLTQYKLLAENKKIAFEVEIRANFKVYTNKTFLEKVLGNIIKNAIFYTEKGFVKIIVDNSKISIQDSGIGIEQKDINNIWGRFFRVKSSKIVDGIGLGLSIVKNISNQEKWKINLTSEVGKGTTFDIIFK